MKLRLLLTVSVLTAGVCVTTLAAQEVSTTLQRDINGRVVSESSTTVNGRTSRSRNVNGQSAPTEQVEERVVRQDATGKTVERVIRQIGPNGQVASTERVVIEETLTPGGSTVKQSTFRTDLNGRTQEAERQVIETRKQGQTVNIETTVQQSTINGSFQTAERRTKVTTGPQENQQSTETVYRPDMNQSLREAQRTVTTSTVKGNQTTSNSATYEPSGNGSMQVIGQRVTVATKRPDGGEIVDTTIYGRVPGRADSSNTPQRAEEQQRVERRVAPDGSTVETVSVRRASTSDPNSLGPNQQISETVCKGKCLPEKTVATTGGPQQPTAQTAVAAKP